LTVTIKPVNSITAAAIAEFLAHKIVTVAPAAVAQGLRKTRYIPRLKKAVKGIDNQRKAT
jgi:hypothetical protein